MLFPKDPFMSGLPVRQIVFILFSLCVLSCATKPENKPPKAAFHFVPQSGTVETNFIFDAINSSDPEDESSSLQIRWDWDSNGAWDTSWGDLVLFEHQFTQQGIHTVTLEVKDSGGNTVTFDRTVAVGNRPVARFSITPLIGTIDSVFTFDASKSLNPGWEESALLLRWDWECDGEWDVAWSNERIQSHQYARDGIFNVALEVRNSESVTNIIISQVYICPPDSRPVVSFTATPDSGSYGLPFLFDASGSFDPQGPFRILKFRWDFESDGTWDTEWNNLKTTSHLYGTKGIYTVSLIVSNADGYVDSTSNNVVAMNVPPSAGFTAVPGNVFTNMTISFDASSSRDLETPVGLLEVRWDWENDETWDTSWTTSKIALKSYESTGTYTVVLEVKDSENLTDIASIQIFVADNSPPTASFTVSPDSGYVTTDFNMDASASSDPDEDSGDDLVFRWDWESDGSWDTSWNSDETITHRHPTSGIVNVTLEVRDLGQLSDSTTREITIFNTPPSAGFTINPAEGGVSTVFYFDAGTSVDLEDGIANLEMRWDWEDDGYWDTQWSTEKVASHQFQEIDTYYIRLQVRDTGGLEDEVSIKLIVTPDIVWDFRYPASTVGSSPAIGNDGTIYIGSEDTYLYAINPDGTLKWRYQTGDQITSSPAIGDNGTIIFGSHDNVVYALQPDGTLSWSYNLGHRIGGSAAIASDGTVYIAPYNGSLWALNPNGSYKWKYEPSGGNTYSSPSIAEDGTIYYGSDNGQLYAVNPDSTLKWVLQVFSNSHSSPAIGADGTIYINDAGWLVAVNPSGSQSWKYLTGGVDGPASPIVGSDGTIYTPGGPYFYAINPDGSLKWIYQDEALYLRSSAAIGTDGLIYVGGSDNFLYAFNASGQIAWKIRSGTGGNIYSSPAIAIDGVVYYGGPGWNVMAIQTQSMGLDTSSWPRFRANNRNTGRK